MGVPVKGYPFPRAWNHLYQSWNGCFCQNQYPEAVFFFAKLYNPAVGGLYQELADNVYFQARTPSLFVMLLFGMCMRARTHGRRFSSVPWVSEPLCALWGRVNAAAASAYRRRVQRTLEETDGPAAAAAFDEKRRLRLAVWAAVREITKAAKLVHAHEEKVREY